MLMHNGNACLLRVKRRVPVLHLSRHGNLARGRFVDTAHNLDARTFPGAVFAKQRQDLCRSHIKRHIADSNRTAKDLGDASELDQWLLVRRPCSLSVCRMDLIHD